MFPLGLFADNRALDRNPPLDVFIQNFSGDRTPVADPVQYVKSLPRSVSKTILSQKEMWEILQTRQLSEGKSYDLYKKFYDWYYIQLPFVTIANKNGYIGYSRFSDFIGSSEFSEISFIFGSSNELRAKELIAFAEIYDYTASEKLNLFLFVLGKGMSTKELVKLFYRWNIEKNMIVRATDYKEYMGVFLDYIRSSSMPVNRKDVLALFSIEKMAVTSVLHESFNADNLAFFNRMLQNPNTDINVQNYLLQTVLHKVSDSPWERSAPYAHALFERPYLKLNIVDFQGWSPVFYIVSYSSGVDSAGIKLFWRRKSELDMSIQDHNLRTLPLLAAEMGMPNLAQFLHRQGAPLPNRVSLVNSYIENDYRAVWFEYRDQFELSKIADIFDAEERRPSISDFNVLYSGGSISADTHWNQFKYYFLFHLLDNILDRDETIRHSYLTKLLFGERTNIGEAGTMLQLVQALHQDFDRFQRLFSRVQNKSALFSQNVFNMENFIERNDDKKTILRFNLLERANINFIPQSDGELFFYTGVSSLLSEAVRANRVEGVRLLMEAGADPTFDEKNFIVRNSIVTAILMGSLLYKYKQLYKEHLRILDILMDHPFVTRDFLNQKVIPGINYADLAALTGHLPALKKMYRKGVTVSRKPLLGSVLHIESIVVQFDFLRTAEFILDNKIKTDRKSWQLKKVLRLCRDVFH